MELTQVECFPATYEGISQFVNKEFPSLFPKEITDHIMNDEFQEIYKETYHTIANSNWIKPNAFAASLDRVYAENKEYDFLITRNVMHLKIGNSELFAGNGITANRIQKSPNQYGCPEFFNFDRKAITIKCYKESDALIYKMIDMYKETPRYPVSDPLPYINDEKNLPSGVIWLGEFFEKDNGNHVFYINQKDYLSIVYMFLNSIDNDGSYFLFSKRFSPEVSYMVSRDPNEIQTTTRAIPISWFHDTR